MHIQVTYKNLTKIVRTTLAAGNKQPIGLIGAPGTAKTQWFKTTFASIYAEHLGIDVADLGFVQKRLAGRDPAEVIGVSLPSKDQDGNLITLDTKAPLITEIERTGREYGILLLDEALQMDASLQKAMADLFDESERTLGGWKLPDGWFVVFTGNRTQDKSGATRLLSHLTNRTKIFEVDSSVSEWIEWSVNNDVHPLLVAFAETELDVFVDAVPTEDGPYCTRRSLTVASKDLTAFTDSDEYDGERIPWWVECMIAANIGATAAHRLVRFHAMMDSVPTAEEIYRDPEAARLPDYTGYQLFAANRAINSASDEDKGEAALQYIIRLRPDLQVTLGCKLLAKSACAGWVLTTPTATAFIAKFHDLLPLADNWS